MSNTVKLVGKKGAITPKVPPFSNSAEQSVLGSLMLDNQSWDLVADVVSAVDFYRSEHKVVFDVLTSLAAVKT